MKKEFLISLEQIQDVRILDAINRNCWEESGLSCIYFSEDSRVGKEAVVLGLIIDRNLATILVRGEDEARFVPFSSLNIHIGFEFEVI